MCPPPPGRAKVAQTPGRARVKHALNKLGLTRPGPLSSIILYFTTSLRIKNILADELQR